MYANTAYLDRARDGDADLSVPFAVMSCGYYKIDSGKFSTERPHGRDDYQLLYIAEGRAFFLINGEEVCVRKGSAVLFRPREVQMYSYYSEDNPEVYWVHFTGSEVDSVLEHYGFGTDENLFFAGTSPNYKRLFSQLIEELQLCRSEFREMLCLTLMEIFLNIKRYPSESMGNTVTDDIERAVRYFNEYYNREICIDSYARDAHMSSCWFIKSFKRVSGVTPMQYILSLRINNAMNLLDNTKYSISEIAAMVGYDNALYFSRIFSRHVGMSPREYRERKR